MVRSSASRRKDFRLLKVKDVQQENKSTVLMVNVGPERISRLIDNSNQKNNQQIF